jgi:hypothetical protein
MDSATIAGNLNLLALSNSFSRMLIGSTESVNNIYLHVGGSVTVESGHLTVQGDLISNDSVIVDSGSLILSGDLMAARDIVFGEQSQTISVHTITTGNKFNDVSRVVPNKPYELITARMLCFRGDSNRDKL